MAPSIEKVVLWILEALEQERQREPDWLKCRVASEVLGTIKAKHGVDDARIRHGLDFCLQTRYVKVLNRQDGQVVALDDDGIRMYATIEKARLDEREKKKWSRTEKIALASFIFTVISFFIGLHIGETSARKSDSKTILQVPPAVLQVSPIRDTFGLISSNVSGLQTNGR